MYRRILTLCCVIIVVITQSGCIGLIVQTPKECKREEPSIEEHDSSGVPPGLNPANPTPSTKDEVREVWGKPDEIITVSEDEETWVYSKTLWCGVWPIIILPIPFVLPVCNGFERIGFRGNEAISIHSRQIDYSVELGFLIPVPSAGAAMAGGSKIRNPVIYCQYPAVSGPAYSKISNIADNMGVVYFYRQDSPGNEDRYNLRIEGIISPTLFNNGYFPHFSSTGTNEFCVDYSKEGCVKIDISPGEIYYIKLQVLSNSRTQLVIVDPRIAEKEISGCRRYKEMLTAN
jgi:hypothetical protein